MFKNIHSGIIYTQDPVAKSCKRATGPQWPLIVNLYNVHSFIDNNNAHKMHTADFYKHTMYMLLKQIS